MGYQTKIQLINRKNSQQWYVNFPAQLAHALDFSQGETLEWFIEDRKTLVLKRLQAPPSVLKKKPNTTSSRSSRRSSNNAVRPSNRTEPSDGLSSSR